jgi:tRNA(Ile)-lysidine synthase
VSEDLLQRTANAIRQHRLLSPGQKILVAVSGGADSMVLLHLLHSLARENRWNLELAHFNHQLRGRASDADEQLVRRTAKKMRHPIYVGRADVKSAAARSKVSVEMAARQLRHAFFARVAHRRRIKTVALAHHADDQVEQFFLRLLRGTGGTGLAGMTLTAPSAADSNLILVRPLLGFSKTDLLEYARTVGISFREDASNQSNDHLRNRIRNELLPLLKEKYQPGLHATVLRLMDIIGAESALGEAAARQWRKKSRAGARTGRVGAGDCFDALALATQRKVVQQQLIELRIDPDFELVEALRQSTEKWITLSPGISASRDAEGRIRLRRFHPLSFNAEKLRLSLTSIAGEASFAGKNFSWAIKKSRGFNGRLRRQPLTESFDADKIGGQITLRHWRAGDRFQPIGMPAPVKLQDLFVNAKIPVARRRRLVLATTKTGDIFWVETLRIAEPFKLTPQTRRQLTWSWSE